MGDGQALYPFTEMLDKGMKSKDQNYKTFCTINP